MTENTIRTAIKQRSLGFKWPNIAAHLKCDEAELRREVSAYKTQTLAYRQKRAVLLKEQAKRRDELLAERDAFVRRMLRHGFTPGELEKVVRISERKAKWMLEQLA